MCFSGNVNYGKDKESIKKYKFIIFCTKWSDGEFVAWALPVLSGFELRAHGSLLASICLAVRANDGGGVWGNDPKNRV